MSNEKELQIAADRIYRMTGEIISEGIPPFAVAAALTMISLQIYKTSLSPEEYNKMVDSISASRDRIQSLTNMVKSEYLQSFH